MKGVFESNNLIITAKLINGIWPFPPMFHSHAEIICLISGSAEITIDGITREMSPGDISFSFPYSIHEYKSAPTATALLVMFSPEIIQDFENYLLNYKPEYPFIVDDGNIVPLLQKIVALAESSEKFAEELERLYLCVAIGEILSRMELKRIENTDVNTVQKVLIYCLQNYKRDITVDSVSKSLFISKNHISRIFASKLGCSFRDYINLLRINDAKQYLKNTDQKIIEIMYECGFKNQSSFNRIFFDVCGITPTEYRKKHQSGSIE